MGWWLIFQTAFRGLLANRFRTMLTMSGIIVGVAALITTLAVGRGSRDAVEIELDGMGRNAIYVNASWRPIEGVGGRRKFYRLTMADWHAISALASVKAATPMMWGREQVVYGSADSNPSVLGVTREFLAIFHWGLQRGRAFTEDEITTRASVVLLGKGVAEKLFGSEDPLDKTIRVGKAPFLVIGLLEPKSGDGVAEDNTVFIPITTAQTKVRQYPVIHQIVAEPRQNEQIDIVADQIVTLLCDRNNVLTTTSRKPYDARTSQQMLKASLETSRNFSILIFLTAALSLLVGGIGIMNTMMMSVFERTREIGVRMAVGARAGDILWLFILEALMLSSVGGMVGIMAGTQLSVLIAEWVQWPPVVSLGSLIVSFASATLVGLLSGLYPAWRASRMEPTECLRSD